MTRAMLAAVLYRQAGSPERAGPGLEEYGDGTAVPAWAASAMCWAVQQGLLNGDNGELRPNDAVGRQALAVILYRRAGSPAVGGMALSGYEDGAAVASWAKRGMTWAVERGILTGDTAGRLNPAGSATRAEVAAVFLRYASLQ